MRLRTANNRRRVKEHKGDTIHWVTHRWRPGRGAISRAFRVVEYRMYRRTTRKHAAGRGGFVREDMRP